MFFFVRAGRFKRPLGGDQEGSQLPFYVPMFLGGVVFIRLKNHSFLCPYMGRNLIQYNPSYVIN